MKIATRIVLGIFLILILSNSTTITTRSFRIQGNQNKKVILTAQTITDTKKIVPNCNLRFINSRNQAVMPPEWLVNEVSMYSCPKQKWLIQIAYYESTFNPNSINPSGCTGLMQFARSTWNWIGCTGDIMNGGDQIRCASLAYDKHLQGHWSTNYLVKL